MSVQPAGLFYLSPWGVEHFGDLSDKIQKRAILSDFSSRWLRCEVVVVLLAAAGLWSASCAEWGCFGVLVGGGQGLEQELSRIGAFFEVAVGGRRGLGGNVRVRWGEKQF